MKIRFEVTIPRANDFYDLFLTTGWNEFYRLNPKELYAAIKQSWYMVSAYHGDRLVGFGRIICDGVVHALILDMIVLPDHQRKGIGGAILKKLLEKCRAHNIRDIQLFCAQDKVAFYKKYGFVERPNNAPAMELKKENKP